MVESHSEKINPLDLIMLILGNQNEIYGYTRFIKYLFLVHQSKIFPKDKIDLQWKPHHYGPYYDDFDGLVKNLSNDNYLKMEEQTTFSGNCTTKFLITIKGRKFFQSICKKFSKNELNDLSSLIKNIQKKSLYDLLKFVYEQYPEYTKNSKIKDKILDNNN